MPVRSATIADLLHSGRRPLFSFEFFPPKNEIQQRQLWQTIREMLAAGEPLFSFEFFPPKTDAGERTLWDAIRRLEGEPERWATV